jgi:tRNA(fMet)-specific endonuclease VapC
MGTVLDTTVFIDLERSTRGRPAASAMAGVAERLESELGGSEEVAIAAITASELLHGVHRATPAHRARREAFVEGLLAAFPALAFDLLVARVHARIWADLVASGIEIGAHDRLVAATAISAGWRVATANVRHFDHIPSLEVVSVQVTEA